ncbi:hypothetical protein EQU24_14935 [Methylotuvimicrobium buryatense]|uniref:Uncharacterized protein n=1 Tax=Methylotuvimicrobium buryatense TaxID=95641 RepID=A0A4P9UPQ9_METBY|nr:hypothetical protein EQU24_14935 [Methylotuvimicrobium buryatense]
MISKEYIPIALQISALTRGGAGVFGKGFDSRDAVTEPTWTYSRRPLTDTPAPKFDQQRVYILNWYRIPFAKLRGASPTIDHLF